VVAKHRIAGYAHAHVQSAFGAAPFFKVDIPLEFFSCQSSRCLKRKCKRKMDFVFQLNGRFSHNTNVVAVDTCSLSSSNFSIPPLIKRILLSVLSLQVFSIVACGLDYGFLFKVLALFSM
jgi:hypothetical protein